MIPFHSISLDLTISSNRGNSKMKESFAVILICCSILLPEATSLHCFLCSPSDHNDCRNISKLTYLEECDERNETPYGPIASDTTTITSILTTSTSVAPTAASPADTSEATTTMEPSKNTETSDVTTGIEQFRDSKFRSTTGNSEVEPTYECYKVITEGNFKKYFHGSLSRKYHPKRLPTNDERQYHVELHGSRS